MKYQRKELFTIVELIEQIRDYFIQNGQLPDVIILPIHEYLYLDYLMPKSEFRTKITTFLGIPLEPIKDNEIDIKFNY